MAQTRPPEARPGDHRAPGAAERGAERYGSVLEQLHEGFQVIGHDWRYLYVNDTVVTHARVPRGALLGRSMIEVYPGIEKSPLFATLSRCMRTRTPGELVNEFVYPDGTSAWFELRVRPVPEGLVVLSIDVSRRKALEAQLRQAQRLEVAGRMAAGLAHDFGNLLSAITGAISLARSREIGPEVDTDLEIASGAAARAGALVEQLLAFCRQRAVRPEPVRIAARVRDFAPLLARSVGRAYTVELELEPPPVVHVDAGALEDVLLNLVVNAADAMPDGGRITVRTADVLIERSMTLGGIALPPGRYAALTVSDEGVGMSAELVGRIFEPFFTTKGEDHGTGLGLSTCYGIVQQAGGAIAVRSEPGQGSAFTVYLPAMPPEGRST